MRGKGIFSIDVEQVFNKIQYTFMIKALNKLGIESYYLSITKPIYEKPTANMVKHGRFFL